MKVIVINEGQSLMDVCIAQYGSVEGFVQLLKDNAVGPDQVLAAGAVFSIDETVTFKPIVATLNDTKAQEASTLISEGQSLVDVCIQEHGSIESLLKMALANNLDLNVNPSPGQSLKLSAADIKRKQLIRYFKQNQVRVNTGFTDSGEVINLGIGWMIIEDTFIVG